MFAIKARVGIITSLFLHEVINSLHHEEDHFKSREESEGVYVEVQLDNCPQYPLQPNTNESNNKPEGYPEGSQNKCPMCTKDTIGAGISSVCNFSIQVMCSVTENGMEEGYDTKDCHLN